MGHWATWRSWRWTYSMQGGVGLDDLWVSLPIQWKGWFYDDSMMILWPAAELDGEGWTNKPSSTLKGFAHLVLWLFFGLFLMAALQIPQWWPPKCQICWAVAGLSEEDVSCLQDSGGRPYYGFLSLARGYMPWSYHLMDPHEGKKSYYFCLPSLFLSVLETRRFLRTEYLLSGSYSTQTPQGLYCKSKGRCLLGIWTVLPTSN